MTDFGVISTFMNAYLNSINTGYSNIQPSVNFIMGFMIILTIITTALLTWVWSDWETVIRGLISRFLIIGFFLLLVEKWQYYTDIIGYGLTALGLKASGSGQSATTFLQDPTSIAMTGYNLFKQLMQTANTFPTGVTGFGNFINILLYGIAAMLVFMAYVVIALQVFVTFLEFKLINLAALVLVPFAIWQKTTFLSDRAIGYMFSAGLKLFVLAMVVSIGVTFTTQFVVDPVPDFANAFSILVGSVMLMSLAIFVPRLAQALITGGPQLGAAEAAIGAGASGALIGGGAYFGGKAAAAIGNALGPTRGGDGGSTNGGRPGLDAVRAAATAGTGGSTAGNTSPFSRASRARGAASFIPPSAGGGISSTQGTQPAEES
jgi:type IV secretion system protein TrbL